MTTTRRIAYLSGPTYRGAAMHGDALPEKDIPEHDLLVAAGKERNLEFVVRRWNDEARLLDGFDGVLIRSCWDYTANVENFCDALRNLALARPGLAIMNAPSTIQWNARKTYLQELARAGLPVIPTLWPEKVDPVVVANAFDTWDAREIVVKPQVGAGARDTIRLVRNAWSAASLIEGPQGPAMIQPFQPAIETEGELSFLVYGGVHAATILKKPAEGNWLAPNSRGARNVAVTPQPKDRAAAIAVWDHLRAALPEPPTYARIDMVRGSNGDLLLMEAELIEPALYFAEDDAGAPALCNAINARLEG
jgi:glutathione synthase/RimK-type ligase-like ATP-grasp enzyme